jgi:ABC-type lipoprotein export system ATPase subunit
MNQILTSNTPMIEMRKIEKTFTNTAGIFRVLKGIDLTIFKGEFVAVVGKSGSGKSTLLNMVTGIDHPTAGQAIVNRVDVHAMSESKRSLWRGNNLGIVFQFFQLLPMLSLLENVILPMDFVNKYDFDERPKRAFDLLKKVGLENQAHKLPMAVSTGQQQCAAIARALATDPPVIAADEPTGNLDSRSAEGIIQLFDDLVENGKTIIMVTHDPSLTERTSRTVIISDGELIDETLAKCFVYLSHRQLLEVTRNLERFSFSPGSTVLEQDQQVDYFFMIVSGELDIKIQNKNGKSVTLARLGPNQFFGEVELLKRGYSIASVRATNEAPVELIAIPHDKFIKILEESPLSGETIGRIVQLRIEENRIGRERL